MKPHALVLLLALAATACSGLQTDTLSPNDGGYQRTGAPRAGEQAVQPNNSYGRIMGGDGHSPL